MTFVRQILLALVLVLSCGVSVSLWHIVPEHLSNLLLYLIGGCFLGSFIYQSRYGHLETDKMIEAQLSRGAILALGLNMCLVGFSLLWEETQMRTVVVGCIGAAAMYAFLREKKPSQVPAKTSRPVVLEPPPKTDPFHGHHHQQQDRDNGDTLLSSSPGFDWDSISTVLSELGDKERQRILQMLQRVFMAATQRDDGDGSDAVCLQRVVWTVEQEAQRLLQAAKLAEREHQDGDMLTKASELVEWAIQKTPEITELDISDLLLAKAVADINHLSSDVTNILVDLHELKAIHNVDRDTALEKSRARALAARHALPLVESNSMVLTEALIASHDELKPFESITGIQVVALRPDEGYVTFEGNGRAWALKQAFSADQGLKVEVRLFEFATGEMCGDIMRRVQRVRSWKKVTDEWPEPV
eukprot:scpid5715/ scgid25068/ 